MFQSTPRVGARGDNVLQYPNELIKGFNPHLELVLEVTAALP